MKLDWITDPHLDHLRSEEELLKFVQELHDRDSDALLVTGDIAESKTIYDFLGILSGAYQRPIYFVLGNHDYYGAWMKQTQQRVQSVCKAVPKGILNWMPDAGAVLLERGVAIVGHDGMYDGREGTPGMEMSMTDFFLPHGIFDLADALNHGARHLFDRLEEIAAESATHITSCAKKAVAQGAKKVIILTHVPPFLKASYFRGRPSDMKSRPWYVNKTLGEALLELAEEYRKVRFVVLAGHTHGERAVGIRENLFVQVGAARYGKRPKFVRFETAEL